MALTVASILNGICNNLIANAIAWRKYRAIGRNTDAIQTNLLLLNSLYQQFPYISTTAQAFDLERIQNILNITQVPL